MKTFESFISQSIGVILGIFGGAKVGGPFGATIGAIGGIYGSEWIEEIMASDFSPIQSSKFVTTVSAGLIAGIFITLIAYFICQNLLFNILL
uniref:Uncharacterized protein n=1 Tax=Panagrolaimus davidi TaxID=227884 RepID=A0A914QWA7_9BILA